MRKNRITAAIAGGRCSPSAGCAGATTTDDAAVRPDEPARQPSPIGADHRPRRPGRRLGPDRPRDARRCSPMRAGRLGTGHQRRRRGRHGGSRVPRERARPVHAHGDRAGHGRRGRDQRIGKSHRGHDPDRPPHRGAAGHRRSGGLAVRDARGPRRRHRRRRPGRHDHRRLGGWRRPHPRGPAAQEAGLDSAEITEKLNYIPNSGGGEAVTMLLGGNACGGHLRCRRVLRVRRGGRCAPSR